MSQTIRRGLASTLLLLAPLGSVAAAQISFGPAPPPHKGPLPVRTLSSSMGSGCGTDCTTIDFEGVGNQSPVGTITGPVNVTFGSNWFGLVDSDVGGDGNFANEPSPSTVTYVSGGAPLPIEFSSGVASVNIFYVAGSTSIPLTLTAFDAPGGTGNVVATATGETVGNGSNCTGDPTGIFCLWDTVNLIASGNTIRSITLSGAMSNQFAFDSMSFCLSGDTDGDGLLDEWETCGVDANGDGTIDLDLPAMGADPLVPDIFVESDAMDGLGASAGALAAVESAFAAQGIQLHVMLDEVTLPLQIWNSDWQEFDALKDTHLGTVAERASSNWPNIKTARNLAVRYLPFASQQSTTNPTGQAEFIGNDAWVASNSFASSDTDRAALFMHSLGHLLGLDDGGGDNIRFKPNHRSVMNPLWTLPHAYNLSGWSLDFSDGSRNTIDEAGFDESAGIGGTLNQTTFVGPPPLRIIVELDGADFDLDGDTDGTGQVQDLTQAGPFVGPTPDEVLSDFDEWGALTLPFRDGVNFADGVHSGVSGNAGAIQFTLRQTTPTPTQYCEGKVSSLGAVASMTSAGLPTMTGPDDFEIIATGVLGQTFGVLVVSDTEQRAAFPGGTLCVGNFTRICLTPSGGTLGASDGELRCAVSQAQLTALGLMPGSVMYAQYLNRDGGFSLPEDRIGSTPGLVFVVGN